MDNRHSEFISESFDGNLKQVQVDGIPFFGKLTYIFSLRPLPCLADIPEGSAKQIP